LAGDPRIDVEHRLAHGLGEGEIPLEIAGVVAVVEYPANAPRLAPVRQKKVFVALGFEAFVPVGAVGVAGVFQGCVKHHRVRRVFTALVVEEGRQVGAAAEPATRGRQVTGVHVNRGNARVDQVGDQTDARSHEPGIVRSSRHGRRHLRGEHPVDTGDMQAAFFEEASVQHPHDAAAAFWAHPGRQLEVARRPGIQPLRRLNLQRFEGGDEAVAEVLEPGPGSAGSLVIGGRRGDHSLAFQDGKPPVCLRPSPSASVAAVTTLSERAACMIGIRSLAAAAPWTSGGAPRLSEPMSRVSSLRNAKSEKIVSPWVVRSMMRLRAAWMLGRNSAQLA